MIFVNLCSAVIRRGGVAVVGALLLLGVATPTLARENIQIVGSSTVYPFITVVAEKFGRSTRYKTPIIESTGSGGGMKLFCAGVGVRHPDITGSSRRIKQSELDKCHANGVKRIIEVKIGYDGIVLANSKKASRFALTRKEIFLALAKQVPNPAGGRTLVRNPYRTWAEINPALPSKRIEVLGPPPTSGTRDAFVELAMEGGCKAFSWIAAMKNTDKSAYKALCHQIREDGAFVEAGENDNLIVQKLVNNPDALGIFGYSFLDQNADVVQGATVEGEAPEFEKIAEGAYPISRPLFIYVKTAHIGVISGIKALLAELSDPDTWGEEGYLSERGLIPMPSAERRQYRTAIKRQQNLQSL